MVGTAADIHDLLVYSHLCKHKPNHSTKGQLEEREPAAERSRVIQGALMRDMLNEAWQFWKEDAFDDCFYNCLKILATPQALDVHKAMVHYMLAYGENEYVYVEACPYWTYKQTYYFKIAC